MKKPVILLGVLVLLIAFAMFYQSSKENRINSARVIGAPKRELLFDALPIGDVRGLRVRDSESEVEVKVLKDRWVVLQRGNYSASFDRIHRAVDTLAKVKIIDKQVMKDDLMGRVKLNVPTKDNNHESGILIQFLSETGEVIDELVLGNLLEFTGGANSNLYMGGPNPQQFVRRPKDENTIWVINSDLRELDSNPAEWLDKAFVSIENVQKLAVKPAMSGEEWSAYRPKEGLEFVLENKKSEGESLDISKVEGINSILAQTSFVDVLPPDKATNDFFKGGVKANFETFDGFSYEVLLVQKKDATNNEEEKTFVTFKVTAKLKDKREPVADEKPEDKQKADTEFLANKKKLEEKLAREKAMEGWVYEVSPFAVGPLTKSRKEVVSTPSEVPAKAATPKANGPKLPFIPSLSSPPPKPAANPAPAQN